MFKKGLFFHLTSSDRGHWLKQKEFLANFQQVDFLELWMEFLDLSSDDIDFLKNELQDYEFIIHAPFINLTLMSIQQKINNSSLDIFKRTIDLAVELDASLITFHGGSYPLFLQEDEVLDLFVQNFQELMNYAKGKIGITIENISNKRTTQISYPVFLSELEKIQKFLPNINFTLDVGHCTQNQDDFIDFLTQNCDKIKNIHLHNGHFGGKAHFGFNKQGDLDLGNFLDLLKKIGYKNYLSLEVLGEQDIEKSWELLLEKLKV